MSATKAMGDLKTFWDNTYVDTYSKYLIFRDIPVNLLLWGCETWLFCTTLKNRLGGVAAPFKTNIENLYVTSER